MPVKQAGTHSAFRLMMNNAALAAWLDVGEREFPLVGRTFCLGRSKDNNVVFNSAKVSRRHALVHAQGGSDFYLVDLGSSNGTHLNGRRVIQPVSLQHGDVIQIGEQSLVFRVETAPEADDQFYMTQAALTLREVNELTCWFLVLDIENFVRLTADVPTDQLGRIVGTWLAECQSNIEKHGGTVSKFLGDGLLAYWNAQLSAPESVAKALDALQVLQNRREPPFRWAVHHGKAVFGAAAAVGELTALGQDLNFLFRMERLAAAQGFSSLVSEAAEKGLAGAHQTQPAGSFPLKGFEAEHKFSVW